MTNTLYCNLKKKHDTNYIFTNYLKKTLLEFKFRPPPPVTICLNCKTKSRPVGSFNNQIDEREMSITLLFLVYNFQKVDYFLHINNREKNHPQAHTLLFEIEAGLLYLIQSLGFVILSTCLSLIIFKVHQEI